MTHVRISAEQNEQELTIPCTNCTSEFREEKFGWRPGLVFHPSWHEWLAKFRLAREEKVAPPPFPEAPYYMDCDVCKGTGEKVVSVGQ